MFQKHLNIIGMLFLFAWPHVFTAYLFCVYICHLRKVSGGSHHFFFQRWNKIKAFLILSKTG